MKKIITIILVLVFALTLCACGGTADNGASGNGNSGGNSVSDKEQETGYVGTWKVVPPVDNFPPLYLVLNEDGTAGWGAKLDNLSPRIWYECEEEDAKENQMELSREDNKGYGDDFYLTEDGKIYMEVNLNVGDKTYDHVYFERQ